MKTKIVILDSRNLFCESIAFALKEHNNIQPFIISDSKIKTWTKLFTQIKPQIVIVGNLGTVILQERIVSRMKEKFPNIKILLLLEGEYLNDPPLFVDGYISTYWKLKEFKNAICHFERDGVIVPRAIANKIVKKVALMKIDNMTQLTPLESKIVKLLCKGKLNKEIAGVLQKKEKTIKNYISKIYLKLGVKNRAEAIIKLVKMKYFFNF